MTPQERIKADAEAYAKSHGRKKHGYYALNYIAGATAEHERAKVLVDALEFVKNNGLCSETTEMINKALEQWKSGKGKEAKVYRPCPHCGKELFRDRNLCCRACGKEVTNG